MNKVFVFLEKYKYIVYCILLSFVILSITSKNSFLYPINDWVDANAFFTMGKSVFNGVVPYKDRFEKKGLLLYLIYGIGYLISNKSFIGPFFIEIIFFSIFLYYSYKSISLFLKDEYSFIMLPILSLIICISPSFVHGGACEELCFPFFAYSIYSMLRYFKGDSLSYRCIFINGLLSGLVFMMKYTLIGFWFGFMMFIFFDMVFIRKDIKKAFLYCLWFLIGMFIPIGLSLVYFAFNGAINDFIRCYFTINMTSYNDEIISLGDRLYLIFRGFISCSAGNGLGAFLLVVFLPLFVLKLKISKFGKVSIILTSLISLILVYWGIRFYYYYYLPLFMFMIISMIGIGLFFDKYMVNFFKSKIKYVVCLLIFIMTIVWSYFGANYKEMIGMDKEDVFLFKYAEYINKYENPTLLNMGYLDAGLYTTTGIVPNTYFFEVQNLPYSKFPDNLDLMKENVLNTDIDFVLIYTPFGFKENFIEKKYGYIYDNYELVYDDKYMFEHVEFTAYLFKLKGLENKSSI